MDSALVQILSQFGFPVFVALYLLVYELPKNRKALENLQDTQRELLIYLKMRNGCK